jgi:hypothetical protein
VVSAGLALACAGAATAHDRWELGGLDDGATSVNILRHADVQFGHDLEPPAPGTPDADWMRVVTKTRHSYEARVSGQYWRGTSDGPDFDRVNAAGAVLTPGVRSEEDVDGGEDSLGRTVRWIPAAGSAEYLRARGFVGFSGLETYDVVFLDTTLFVPRWNNTATQTTVVVLQNTTSVTVTGFVYFHSAAGALLATANVSVPSYGVQLIATASISALAGQSGSAQIAQLGGYGALAGKAVALESASGFTFDTPIGPVPR